MYSEEIEKYIEERNHRLGGDEILEVILPWKNPQLTKISYSAGDRKYFMEDDKEKKFEFEAMPYQEAKEKGLVKVKSRK